MNTCIRRETVFFLVIILLSWFLPANVSAEIKLAVLPRLNTVEIYTMFKPLEEYLTKEIGEKVTVMVARDFSTFKDMVRSGQVELGFSNPLIYVELKNSMSLEPLALASEFKAGTRFRGIIIARKDSGIDKLQDLRGKNLIFVDKDSAAGYIFQMLLLSKAGLNIHRDFTLLPFAKKHDNVTIAVFNKSADAGGIREDDFEKMKDKVDISQLKIVGYTDYFPNWPMFALPKLNKDLAMKIKTALLRLKPGASGAGKILGRAKIDGFAPVADKDYDELRKALKIVNAL